MNRHASSASARRLILNTLSNKRERKARANAKLAHEHLVMLGDVFGLMGHRKVSAKDTPEGWSKLN